MFGQCVSFRIFLKLTGSRFFPQSREDADRSGNCKAGTVVDRDVAHPTEFDFIYKAMAVLAVLLITLSVLASSFLNGLMSS